jgi:hypothetical protein
MRRMLCNIDIVLTVHFPIINIYAKSKRLHASDIALRTLR